MNDACIEVGKDGIVRHVDDVMRAVRRRRRRRRRLTWKYLYVVLVRSKSECM